MSKTVPSGEGVAQAVLDVNDVEATHVSLSRRDHTNTTQVVAAGHHAQVSGLELDEIDDLARRDVVAHRVEVLDLRIRVADGAAVVGHDVGDSLRTSADLLHTAQLVLQKHK